VARSWPFCLFVCAAFLATAGWAQAPSASTMVVIPQNMWAAYKQRFITSEGRLVDDSALDVSHSEGQGYAMLLAAYSGDAATFSKLWAWTAANLYIRGDGLAAWRWRPQDKPHVLDRNNATDGDLLIAWALIEGSREWLKPEYASKAREIALAIGRQATYETIFGRALSPGVAGFGPKDFDDGPVVNPSYWVFPALDELSTVAPEIDWTRIRDSGLALLDGAKFGPRRLPSDWVSLKNGIQPAAGYPNRFGYDAIRVPLYLVWSAPRDRTRLAAFAEQWTGAPDHTPAIVDLETGTEIEPLAEDGYRAVAALVRCAVHNTIFPDNLRSAAFDRYYSATLHMLSLAALHQRLPQCW
jgi:endo-1,4-beta-D-glucanase Y